MSILRRITPLCINLRHYSSALYITGDKASSNFVVLVPHIDFEDRMENRSELEENIKLRQKQINLDKYWKYWEFYKHLHEKMLVLNSTKRVINEHMVELKKEPEKNKEEIEKLQLHAKQAKDNYKNLRDYTYPVEEMAVLNVLSIPNVLDKRTPHTDHYILYNYLDKPILKARNHFELAVNSNLLYYLNPTFSVLENDAALFEHSLINYFYDNLLTNSYISTVNTSFTRSIIMEGCCVDYLDPKQVFTVYEEDSKYSVAKLHFVGNASLFSFMAYFAKFSIQPNYLPLKFFTSGKQYQPLSKKHTSKSLLELNQYSTIDIFSITKNNEQDTENHFQEVIEIVKQLYDSLGYHYRLVYVPANELRDYETLRVAIQMFSTHLQTYIEIGNISLCGDYLSKRLLVSYNEDKTRKYSNIIHGTLINVQKLLACVLEYNDLTKKELLSDLLKKYSLL